MATLAPVGTAGESKGDRFRRLAERRTEELVKKLGTFSNLSNTYQYDFEQKHIDLIFNTLENELRATREKFEVALEKKRNRRDAVPEQSPPSNGRFRLDP